MSKPESLSHAAFTFRGPVKLVGSIVGVVALFVGTLIAVCWAYDARQDRNHTMVVTAVTPVFKGYEENCGGTQTAILQPGAQPQIRRIRYWKNCATVDVVLSNGQEGFIVMGDGDVRINPPLP